MSLKADIERRIEKKRSEIATLRGEIDEREVKISTAEAVITELTSILKALPKDEHDNAGETTTERVLRRGSDVYRAREVLRRLKVATYIDKIIEEMGEPLTKEFRRSLASQLSWYAKRNQIFTKPESNVFGLKEWESAGGQEQGEKAQASRFEVVPKPETVAKEAVAIDL